MTRPRRKRVRIVDYIDEVRVCGVTLRRLTLPNGKRVYEEEGIRTLMIGDVAVAPTEVDAARFELFSRPPSQH